MRLNLGIRRRLAPLFDGDRRKIELANALLFALPGSPFLYYGDEIGMGDNIWLDDRAGMRTPLQWDDGPNAGFSTAAPTLLYLPLIDDERFGYQRVNVRAQRADAGSLWHTLRKLLSVRKEHLAFGLGSFEFLENAKAIRKSKSKEDRDALIEERNEIQSDIAEIEAELKDCYTFVEKKQKEREQLEETKEQPEAKGEVSEEKVIEEVKEETPEQKTEEVKEEEPKEINEQEPTELNI